MDQHVAHTRPRATNAASRVGLTDKDLHLLRAALLDGANAAAAFAAWRPGVDLADIDYGWSRLLPLVQRNLMRCGIDDPWLQIMAGIRRHYWARNLKLLHHVCPVLAGFVAQDVPVILLKGAGLLATFGNGIDLRPMDDIDILVRPDRVAPAVRILAELGWQPLPALPCEPAELPTLPGRAGWTFVGPDKTELDLHWRALHLDAPTAADTGFWQRAQPARLAGQSVQVLAPADQLLHVCVHAANGAGFSGLRWAADAALVMRAGAERLNWATLCEEARRRRFATLMHDCLRFLATDLLLPVPDLVFAELRRGERPGQRLETLITRGNPLRHGMARRVLMKFVTFRRMHPKLLDQPWRKSLIPFLRQVTETTTTRGALGVTLFHLLRRPDWLRRALRLDRDLRRAVGPLVPAALGARIDLTHGGFSAALAGWWSHADQRDGGRWTSGPEARILWDVAGAPRADLLCDLDAEGFVSDRHPRVTVRVFANDRRVATLRFVHGRTPALHQFTISYATIADGARLSLCFDIRHPCSPAAVGLGADGRLLGLLVRWITLVPRG